MAAYHRYSQETLSPEVRRERLVQKYGPLVKKVAQRIFRRIPCNMELRDLVAAGIIGLILAEERFDPSLGKDFATFAEFRIKGNILDEIRKSDPLSRRSRLKANKLAKARKALEIELGRTPTDPELAARLEIPLNQLQELVQECEPIVFMQFDEFMDSHDVEDTEYLPPDRLFEQKELREKLKEGIKQLPEKLRMVLSLYYFNQFSFKDIGKTLDISESRACQLHKEAIGVLQSGLRDPD